MPVSACTNPLVIFSSFFSAGGYDALWVLVVDDPAAIASVEQVWLEWKEMSVCPLASRAEPSGGLRVVEDLKEVDGLEGAIGGGGRR
jgi:phosphomevalonate kinase